MPSFRLDRFLTLCLFHPLIRKKETTDDQRIPILMYHSISDDKESASHPYYHINTSASGFVEQMRFLSDHDYSVIDLKDMRNCFEANNTLTNKYVVITFDDGYRDFYTNAFPVLQKYHFPATVFLPTDFIGNKKNKIRNKAHLTWDQVSELSASGISFGSHTVTHPELSRLNNKDVEYEIGESKKAIEYRLGKAIDNFSYPFKFPDGNKVFIEDLRTLLQKHGYNQGVSTRIGRTYENDDLYFRKRIPINSQDDLLLFRAKMEGGYDWLHNVQKLFKTLRYNSLEEKKNA